MQLGFIQSLFDFSFSSFITTKLIKFIYVVAIALNALIALGIVAGAFEAGFFKGVFALFVLAPLAFVFLTMIARLWMELVIVLFRTAESMRETADHTRRMAHREGVNA